MQVLDDTLFIGARTLRTRAYAQAMARAGIAPSVFIRLSGSEPTWNGPKIVEGEIGAHNTSYCFKPGVAAVSTFTELGADTVDASDSDVNSESFVSLLREFPQGVAIYSGSGGVILREKLLGCGKLFLHIHGGYVPDYRGSTTFYYSILSGDRMGATALWMSRETFL